VTAKRVVALLLLALAAYFALIGYRGVYLLSQPKLELKVLGGAVLVLPLVGLWVVVAELRFGRATQRLGRQLDAEGEPPDPELPRTAGGRISREAADALFEERRIAVEADPEQWRGWYRLAVAYDLAGDRKRARAAMRTAIEHDARRPEGPGG
jgi:cytochrome c-type biogenesis protein CcmH/NrfG